MALGGHELLLIVRAQNQASQALRRVAMDTARLGSIRDMHLRQQQLAINQAKSMAQKQGILNRLQNMDEAGVRAQTLAQTRSNRVQTVQRGLLTQRAGLERKIASMQQEFGAQHLQMQNQIIGTNARRLSAVRAEEEASQRYSQSVRKMNMLRKNGEAIVANEMMSEAQYANALRASEQAVVSNAKSLGTAQLRSAAASTSLARLTATQKNYGQVLDDTKYKLSTVNKRIEENAARGVNANTTLAATQAKLARDSALAKQQLQNVNSQIAQNIAQQNALSKAIRAQRWERFRVGAAVMTHLGRVMQMAGLVGGAALGYLGYQAAQFNSQATLVATQTGKVGSGFQTIIKNSKFLQTALLGVMRVSTATRDEITQAAYDIYSSTDVSLGGGIRLLKMFARASIAGMTPLQDVTAAGITVMNDFKLSIADMPAIMQRMFAAVRFGRMNFQQFVGTLSQTVPAFAAAGQSFDNLAGSLAFLTRRMPNIRMAATGLSRMMEIMGRKEFIQGAKEYGVALEDATGKLKPLPQVLDLLVKRFPELKKGGTFLQNFFKFITAGVDKKGGLQGTIQARRVFTMFVKDLAGYHQISGQVISDNNEFDRSFAAMSRTAGVQFSLFLNNLKAFGITMGAVVLPWLVKFTKPLQDLAKWFENLDAKQKATIGKYAAYGAAFLLFGGTVLSVGGMIVSFIAILGKMGIAGAGLGATFLVIIGAVKVLRGEWRSLSDAVNSGVNTMLGSWQGFIGMSALVVVAALRIRKAFLGLVALRAGIGAAAVGGAATGGTVGLLGGIAGAFTTGRLTAMYKMQAGAGRLAASLAGAGAFAAALPAPLLVAAGAIGVAAAGAALWKLHMEGVDKHTKRVNDFQQQVKDVFTAPRKEMASARELGLDVRDVKRYGIEVDSLSAQIKKLKAEISKANAAQKPELQRELSTLTIQRADALDNLRTANNNANASFDATGRAIKRQIDLYASLGGRSKDLATVRQEIKRMKDEFATQPTDFLLKQIRTSEEGAKMLKNSIATLRIEATTNLGILRNTLAKQVRDFQSIDLLPKLRVGQVVDFQRKLKLAIDPISALTAATMAKRRQLTIPEMKAVIRAVVDPKALNRMPAAVRKAILSVGTPVVPVKVRVQQADARRALPKFAKQVGQYLPAIKVQADSGLLTRGAKKARSDTAKIFRQRIIQHVELTGPGKQAAVNLGATLAAGVAEGFKSVSISKTLTVTVIKSVKTAKEQGAKARSPSRLTRDEIGIPLMQGINVGILSQMGLLEKTVRLAIDLFNGPWLTSDKFTQAKKKVRVHVRDIIKDLQMQTNQLRRFNASLATLARRGVPLALLDQLSQLGAEGTKNIALLASASRRDLNRYVAVWKRAMAEIRKSNRSSFETIVGDLHNFMDQAAQTLLDKWNEIHDGLKSAWGNIFQGFDDKIGDGFKSALETWQSNLDDLQKQVKDAYDQIADIQKQARDHITEEFGKLFEGAYLASEQIQNKLNWGIALNIDDLTKDLAGQLAAFTKWRSDLASLAGRIPPALLSQLADLGPQAATQVAALASATQPQLDNYVGLWQQSQDAITSAVNDAIPDKAEFQTQINTLLGQISDLMTQINNLIKPQPLNAADMIGNLQKDVTDQLTASGLINQLRKKGVPAELLAELAQLGPEALPYLQTLNTMTSTELKKYVSLWTTLQKDIDTETTKLMNDQIALWKKHGADIAAGIIAGVMSEQEALLKFFRKLFQNLLKQARKETKSHSPSMVFAALGEDLVLGLQMGLARRKPILGLPTVNTPAVAGGGNGGAPIYMTVNAHKTESLDTTLSRAAFRLRNRKV